MTRRGSSTPRSCPTSAEPPGRPSCIERPPTIDVWEFSTEQLLPDNGCGYLSHVFRPACSHARVQHLRPRPYRPCTNGKAERVIQTLLREWAYSRPYRCSRDRTRALCSWLIYYNLWRPQD